MTSQPTPNRAVTLQCDEESRTLLRRENSPTKSKLRLSRTCCCRGRGTNAPPATESISNSPLCVRQSTPSRPPPLPSSSRMLVGVSPGSLQVWSGVGSPELSRSTTEPRLGLDGGDDRGWMSTAREFTPCSRCLVGDHQKQKQKQKHAHSPRLLPRYKTDMFLLASRLARSMLTNKINHTHIHRGGGAMAAAVYRSLEAHGGSWTRPLHKSTHPVRSCSLCFK